MSHRGSTFGCSCSKLATPFKLLRGLNINNNLNMSACYPHPENLLTKMLSIPTLSHPFTARLSIPKTSKIDLSGPAFYGVLKISPLPRPLSHNNTIQLISHESSTFFKHFIPHAKFKFVVPPITHF